MIVVLNNPFKIKLDSFFFNFMSQLHLLKIESLDLLITKKALKGTKEDS